jgi:hypothetical protein
MLAVRMSEQASFRKLNEKLWQEITMHGIVLYFQRMQAKFRDGAMFLIFSSNVVSCNVCSCNSSCFIATNVKQEFKCVGIIRKLI